MKSSIRHNPITYREIKLIKAFLEEYPEVEEKYIDLKNKDLGEFEQFILKNYINKKR